MFTHVVTNDAETEEVLGTGRRLNPTLGRNKKTSGHANVSPRKHELCAELFDSKVSHDSLDEQVEFQLRIGLQSGSDKRSLLCVQDGVGMWRRLRTRRNPTQPLT